MTSEHLLPDSRLTHRPDFGCVMVDWPVGDGKTVRLEAQPIFCANCGKMYGFVPKENCSFAFWLCAKCAPVFGTQAGLCEVPDDEFNKSVVAEIRARFGRDMTAMELQVEYENNNLGPALLALIKDSPYAVPNPARTG